MMSTSRLNVLTAVALSMIAAAVGCSSAKDAPTAAGAITTPKQAASSVVPQAPTPQPDPTAGGIDATIAADGSTSVRLGGPPMRFTVKLVNNGPYVAKVGLVVSLGHCSCGPPGASMMAKGVMRMLGPQTRHWLDVPYVRQGTGMDFITANLVPPFPLSHGETAGYQLAMQLDAEQSFPVTDGDGGIEVTVVDPDDPMEGDRLGTGNYLPIRVET